MDTNFENSEKGHIVLSRKLLYLWVIKKKKTLVSASSTLLIKVELVELGKFSRIPVSFKNLDEH